MVTDKEARIKELVSRGRDENGHIRHEAVFELRRMKVPAAAIAKEFGVSRNAIYKIIGNRKELLDQKHKTDIMRLSPWRDVEPEHAKAAQRGYIANHIEFMLTNGEGMEEYKLNRLRYFWGELGNPQDKVLTYDRDEPRNQWSSTGGWKYVTKEDSDGDLIVRTDDELSAEQQKVLVRPANWKNV